MLPRTFVSVNSPIHTVRADESYEEAAAEGVRMCGSHGVGLKPELAFGFVEFWDA